MTAYTRRCSGDAVSDGGSTPPTSTIILGTLEPSKTALISNPRKSPVFGAFSLSRPAVIGTLPLALSAGVPYSWRNTYLLFGCTPLATLLRNAHFVRGICPKRDILISLAETHTAVSTLPFGMSSIIETGQAYAHSRKSPFPLDISANIRQYMKCARAEGVGLGERVARTAKQPQGPAQ